jgi:hypothetical protein
MMRRFHFYIDDLNHARPVELLAEMANAERARDYAAELLARAPSHVGVEVCEQGRRVTGLGTFATRTYCGLGACAGRRRHARLTALDAAAAMRRVRLHHRYSIFGR